jgi:acyl-coenzyme A thioesterase PaaI-like protein
MTDPAMTDAGGNGQMGSRGAEARRLGDAMRLVIERLVGTTAPAEELAAAADQLEAVAAALAPYPQGRLYDGYAESANAGDPHAFFDWSPMLGRANPLAPPIVVEGIDGRVVARVRYGSAYEGPPGCVHGGHIAAGFDEILGVANSVSGTPAMTGTLTIRYRKPTPLYRDLRYVAYLDKISGRKVSTRGELWDGDVLTAEAEGLFIRVGVAKFAELMAVRDEQARD